MQDHPINRERAAQGKAPANIVLLRGCGVRIAVQPFRERWGLRGCMVAPTRIIAGLGMSLGLHLLEVPGAAGAVKGVPVVCGASLERVQTSQGQDWAHGCMRCLARHVCQLQALAAG